MGWIWTGYIKVDGSAPQAKPPKEEISKKQDKTERLFVGKVTEKLIDVRTWAGEEYPNIKKYPHLAKGNLVDVMNYTQTANDKSKWYYVKIAGKYFGFVSAKYVEKA